MALLSRSAFTHSARFNRSAPPLRSVSALAAAVALCYAIPAHATCDNYSPPSNTVVTCSGTVTTAVNGQSSSNVTVNILAGSTFIAPWYWMVDVGNGSSVNNAGTMSLSVPTSQQLITLNGASASNSGLLNGSGRSSIGIGGAPVDVFNSGTIDISGINDSAMFLVTTAPQAKVTNSGLVAIQNTVSGAYYYTGYGIFLSGPSNTITNTGQINVTGLTIAIASPGTTAVITNSASGQIVTTGSSQAAGILLGSDYEIPSAAAGLPSGAAPPSTTLTGQGAQNDAGNYGTIQTSGAAAPGIEGFPDPDHGRVTIGNLGTILTTGQGSPGVDLYGTQPAPNMSGAGPAFISGVVINLENSGTITTQGTGSPAVRYLLYTDDSVGYLYNSGVIQALASDGIGVSINPVSAGIPASSGSGTVVVNDVSATITGASGTAIQSGFGVVLVDNAGQINGNVILAPSSGNGLTLHTGGRIAGYVDMGAGGANLLTLLGSGTDALSTAVTGGISQAAYLYKDEPGTWTWDTPLPTVTDVTVNDGTLVVPVDASGASFTINSTATLMSNGVLGDVNNLGTLIQGDANGAGVLRIKGDYAGTGLVIVHADLSGTPGLPAPLQIGGGTTNANSTLKVIPTSATGAATSGDGVRVVSVAGASSATAFHLTQPLTVGTQTYSLVYGGVGADVNDGQWYLRSATQASAPYSSPVTTTAPTVTPVQVITPVQPAHLVPTQMVMAGGLASQDLMTYSDRLSAGQGRAAWIKSLGSHDHLGQDGDAYQYRGNGEGVEGGATVYSEDLGASGRLLLGVWGYASNDVGLLTQAEFAGPAGVREQRTGAGLTATWVAAPGGYVDGWVLQSDEHGRELTANGSEGFRLNALTASLEAGQPLTVSREVQLVPQLQWITTNAPARQTMTQDGSSAMISAHGSALRAGINAVYQAAPVHGRSMSFYAGVDGWDDHLRGRAQFADQTLTTLGARRSDIHVGAVLPISKTADVAIAVRDTQGTEGSHSLEGNVRASWRF